MEILTLREFAKRANVTKQLVYHYVTTGLLKSTTIKSEIVGVSEDQLKPFLARPLQRIRRKPYANTKA